MDEFVRNISILANEYINIIRDLYTYREEAEEPHQKQAFLKEAEAPENDARLLVRNIDGIIETCQKNRVSCTALSTLSQRLKAELNVYRSIRGLGILY